MSNAYSAPSPESRTTVQSRALIYDSAARRPPLVNEIRNLVEYRGLLKLLIGRDLTLRYKRSVLGVWWTLLNPILTTAVMWLVFSTLFRFPTGDTPYLVYLMPGVVLVTYFTQGVNTVGQSLVQSAGVLTKLYVPPEVFAVSAGCAAGVNFAVSLVPVVVLQLVLGVGLSWKAALLPIPLLAMLALITGLGLLVATAAVRFHDTLDFVGILLVLVGYLTPSFYPLSIVPEQYQWVLKLNPVYHYLDVLRDLLYGDVPAGALSWIVMITTAVLSLTLGTYVFSRRWPKLAALL